MTIGAAAEPRTATLPPTLQPGLDPIGKLFSKLKAFLQARAKRTVEALWCTVCEILRLIKPQECANYLTVGGYDLE